MRGLGSVCSYPPGVGRGDSTHGGVGQRCSVGGFRASGPVQDRVQHLEDLVLSMMQHVQPGHQTGELRQRKESGSQTPVGQTHEQTMFEHDASFETPSASEYGSATVSTAGVRYVNSAHWAAVLEGIADLKDHLDHMDQDERDDTRVINVSGELHHVECHMKGPHLLSGCAFATKEGILASIPPRAVVDRLVSRYFNSFDMSPGECSVIVLCV